MATNYPSALDNSTSLPYPSSTDDLNSPNLAEGQDNQNDAVIAIETLFGTNSSQTTPSAQYNVLQATSASASEWAKLTANNVSSSTGTGDFVFATSPTITGATLTTPTINNPTLKTDSVVGYTTSDSGTLYSGITVSSGNVSMSGTLSVTGATSLAALTASGNIKANTSNPVWQYLGYAKSTSNFTTQSTSFVLVTGVTSTVTIPSGCTAAKVSIVVPAINLNIAAGNYWNLSIYKDGSPIQAVWANSPTTSFNEAVSFYVIDPTPSAGSHTYALYAAINSSSYTLTITAGTAGTSLPSNGPTTILVECC